LFESVQVPRRRDLSRPRRRDGCHNSALNGRFARRECHPPEHSCAEAGQEPPYLPPLAADSGASVRSLNSWSPAEPVAAAVFIELDFRMC
jgi:hypothetical protein